VRPLIILIVLCATIFPAHVQTISDTDVNAAYCLGVLTEQERSLRDRYALGRTDAAHIVAERRQRFWDYIAAKGFLDSGDTSAINVTTELGSRPEPGTT
jgi:hypothetical protein